MKKPWLRLCALVVLLFSVVACNTSTNDVTGELFSDADLRAAQMLESSSVNAVHLAELTGKALDASKNNGESALSALKRSSLQTASIPTKELHIDAVGYMAYVHKNGANYSIRVRRTSKGGVSAVRTMYRGKYAIDSVAINDDGSLLSFIAEVDGNYDVFAFDRTGDTFGQSRRLVRLTQTEADESNISQTLDGSVHLWQGVDTETGLASFNLFGVDLDAPASARLTVTAPFGLTEPSISGEGSWITFIADIEGAEIVAIIPSDLSDNPTALYDGADFSAPSLSNMANELMFKVVIAGSDVVAVDNIVALTFIADAPEGSIHHPYITSDGLYFIYSLNGEVRARDVILEDPSAAKEEILDYGYNKASYWAKSGFDKRYFGSTLGAKTFTRPDDGSGLSDAERTNAYHVYGFDAPVSDFFEVLSLQEYDGYLLLYEGDFDPYNPEKNLLIGNDDFGAGYDPEESPAGTSRVVAYLEKGMRYVAVTTACGDPDAGCGPNEGTFINLIRRSEPPPPPYELPEPDDSRFNITLRFVDDNLTEEQQQVLIEAAERWSAIITEDIANLPGFNLPANFVYPNTGEVTGTLDDVLIDVAFPEIDGMGGVLGRAGPILIREEGMEDEFLTTYGVMEFDLAEFGEGGFFNDPQQYNDVIVHEMGHVIGIGTLWTITGNTEGVLSDPPTVPPGLPNPDYDPRFTGTWATMEYQTLTDAAGYETEDSVPIANTGGPGNFNGHWREITFGDELMTPYAGGVELLSRMTAASLGDIGYSVNPDSAAVDQEYALPPPRVPAVFKQTAPEDVEYAEGGDFLAASDSAKAVAAGMVVNVDLNLADLEGSTSACEAEDFDGLDVSGKIALVRRGACAFADKVLNAQDAGATAVIIMNQGNTDDRKGLLDPSLGDATDTIPVLFVTFDTGTSLAGTAGLEVFIDTAGGDAEFNLHTAALAPKFEEEVLRPIGTVGPGGKINLFK